MGYNDLWLLYSNQPRADPNAAPDNASEIKLGTAKLVASVLFDEGGRSFPPIILLASPASTSISTPSFQGRWKVMYPLWGWVLVTNRYGVLSVRKTWVTKYWVSNKWCLPGKKNNTKEMIILVLWELETMQIWTKETRNLPKLPWSLVPTVHPFCSKPSKMSLHRMC